MSSSLGEIFNVQALPGLGKQTSIVPSLPVNSNVSVPVAGVQIFDSTCSSGDSEGVNVAVQAQSGNHIAAVPETADNASEVANIIFTLQRARIQVVENMAEQHVPISVPSRRPDDIKFGQVDKVYNIHMDGGGNVRVIKSETDPNYSAISAISGSSNVVQVPQ